MPLFNSKKKLIAAGVSLVAVAGLATGAVAFFTTTGAGSGSATVGTSTALVLHQDAITYSNWATCPPSGYVG